MRVYIPTAVKGTRKGVKQLAVKVTKQGIPNSLPNRVPKGKHNDERKPTRTKNQFVEESMYGSSESMVAVNQETVGSLSVANAWRPCEESSKTPTQVASAHVVDEVPCTNLETKRLLGIPHPSHSPLQTALRSCDNACIHTKGTSTRLL